MNFLLCCAGASLWGMIENEVAKVLCVHIMPQLGRSDSWTPNEGVNGECNCREHALATLTELGTIHTHPSHDQQNSSIDQSTIFKMIVGHENPSYLSIIYAPTKKPETSVYILNNKGKKQSYNCNECKTEPTRFHSGHKANEFDNAVDIGLFHWVASIDGEFLLDDRKKKN